ncbi:MAG TPA: DUF6498-containing protein [Spirochaetota bacterium]|nr:DUF6498-containing protein [Spirochaetota bacterium]HPJ35521.1 DUF6498-containing protein [Spirochaetota bacterium]
MNRIVSILLSFFDDIIPLMFPSKGRGFVTLYLMIAANITPLIGIIMLGWNPFIILFIYWFESAIIGVFNIIKMLISGAVQNRGFSSGGFSLAVFLSVFFTFHYGIFMLVHGIFLIFFYSMFTDISLLDQIFSESGFGVLSGLFLPDSPSAAGILESELFPVIALFIYHLISFMQHFVLTGEYDSNGAEDYMMRPYKRIIIMQLTIIFGAFALFMTGFKSIVFIIIWIGLKILGDMKLTAGEIRLSKK